DPRRQGGRPDGGAVEIEPHRAVGARGRVVVVVGAHDVDLSSQRERAGLAHFVYAALIGSVHFGGKPVGKPPGVWREVDVVASGAAVRGVFSAVGQAEVGESLPRVLGRDGRPELETEGAIYAR